VPSIAGVSVTVSTLVAEALLENVPEPTLVRVRGTYGYSETALDGSAVLTLGIMVVNEPALTAGVASVPQPQNDIGSDWLWWDSVPLLNVATAGEDPLRTGVRTIDSKAMRKIKNNQVLVLMTQVTGIGAAAGVVTVVGAVRVLFKR